MKCGLDEKTGARVRIEEGMTLFVFTTTWTNQCKLSPRQSLQADVMTKARQTDFWRRRAHVCKLPTVQI
jgi:hypothetical protein